MYNSDRSQQFDVLLLSSISAKSTVRAAGHLVLQELNLCVGKMGDPLFTTTWTRIFVQVTIYRRLLIGRDGHLDQSEAYDIS